MRVLVHEDALRPDREFGHFDTSFGDIHEFLVVYFVYVSVAMRFQIFFVVLIGADEVVHAFFPPPRLPDILLFFNVKQLKQNVKTD